MKAEELIAEKKPEILKLAEQYGAKSLRLFGSVARGESRPDSDIDLLVEFKPEAYDWDHYIGLIHALEDLLEREIDLVTEKSISKYMLPYVLAEAKPL